MNQRKINIIKINHTFIPFNTIALLLFGHALLKAQMPVDVLNASYAVVPVDTLLIETAAETDSTIALKAGGRSGSDLEGPVTYEARIIENLIEEETTILVGRAQVNYTDIQLKAEKITLSWDTRSLIAEGLPDTIWTVNDDGDSVRTIELKGQPEFTEAGDVMVGEVMTFNFETKRGRVLRGRTEYDQGFYHGQALKIHDKSNIYVGDADFSTCDLEGNKHFHFYSKQMKIKANDKVIAKPIVFYLGRIPVAALPFAVFPIQKGRNSGLVIPKYGESSTEGRYLRGLGYYWAPSEYFDTKTTLDFFEKSGFLFRGNMRYHKRYQIRGNISGSMTRKDFEANNTKDRRWDLRIQHDQTISPNTNFTVNATLVSSPNLYKELSSNRNQRLIGQLQSNAKLNHRWGRSGNISLHLNQTRYMQDYDPADSSRAQKDIVETMPQVNISNQWTSLIPTPKRGSGRSGSWLQDVRMPYSFRFTGKRDRTTYKSPHPTDKNEGLGLEHKLSLYISPKLFGIISMQPRINYTESWVDRRIARDVPIGMADYVDREEKGFFTRRTFDAGVSMNTKVYGIFQSKYIKDVLVRHVITPTVSFNYRPDFSEEKWGIYETFIDTDGNIVQYDPFQKSMLGGTPRGSSKSMSFSANNLFQMKTGQGEDVKKFDLFTYNISTNYNWELDSLRFGAVNSSLRANLFRQFNLSMNATHSLYQNKAGTGSNINHKFIDNIDWTDWDSIKKARFARMTNFSLNLDFTLKSGGEKKGAGLTHAGSPLDFASMPDRESFELLGQPEEENRFEMDDEVESFSIPWSLRMSMSYSKNTSNPAKPTKKVWGRPNLEFNLTPNWKISWGAQLDFDKKEVVSQDFVFYRDLHCWEARIVWVPTGYSKRFYLRINIKSSMLKDIKVEKGSGRRSIYGY